MSLLNLTKEEMEQIIKDLSPSQIPGAMQMIQSLTEDNLEPLVFTPIMFPLLKDKLKNQIAAAANAQTAFEDWWDKYQKEQTPPHEGE